MTIKYGEFTIIYDVEPSLLTSMLIWFKCPPPNPKYVFLFEDGEVCEYDDKTPDLQFKFLDSIIYPIPLHFEKSIKTDQCHQLIYFHKRTNIERPHNSLSEFNQLFHLYSKYDSRMNIESDYNCIFYHYKTPPGKPDIFGIVRIKSSECMPRFQFAYDSNEFTKEEIIYLIHYITSKHATG